MKIVCWNCNRSFHKKFELLEEFDADIYVIQECNDPKKPRKLHEWASNYVWVRNNKVAGVGIFAKDNIELEPIEYDNYFKQFLPVKVNDTFNILNVWTKPPYIEEIHNFHHVNKFLFNENLVMCGDFNANAIWDKEHIYPDKNKSFTELVRILKDDGIENAYTLFNDEKIGSETQPTSFYWRNPKKHYHIDYVFANSNVIKSFNIENPYKWNEYSDHFPLTFEIDETKF